MSERPDAKAAKWAGAALAALTWAYVGVREAKGLEVVQHRVTVPGLPAPVRLLQLSDLHLEAPPGRRERRLVEVANSLEADLICLTGDLVSSTEVIPGCGQLLSRLEARIGKFAVTGNNEYENPVDLDSWQRMLEAAGVVFLNNSAVAPLPGLALLGLDDPIKGHPKPAEAYAQAPENHFRIWLAHSPHIAQELAKFGPGLLLAGHTHGGQFCLPGGWPPVLRTPFWRRKHASGFSRKGPLLVYVSRGYGYSLLPVRYFCRPEITLLELAPRA